MDYIIILFLTSLSRLPATRLTLTYHMQFSEPISLRFVSAHSASSGCRHGTDDGVTVRILYVFSGGAYHGSVGPGPLPHATPQESFVLGRDGPFSPGTPL